VQPLQQQVRYHIKHQGDYFYKISNEEDKYNFKITKFRVSDDLKSEDVSDSVQIETRQQSEV
jgi:protease II